MTCELYRHFDKDGVLVYVGISNSALKRMSGHRSQSKWFDMVVKIEIERFPTRDAALAAEETAIQNEKPLLNLRYGRRYGILSRNPEKQRRHEADLAEAVSKGIKVNKGRGIRWQIDMAEKGVKYPYGIDEERIWRREQANRNVTPSVTDNMSDL